MESTPVDEKPLKTGSAGYKPVAESHTRARQLRAGRRPAASGGWLVQKSSRQSTDPQQRPAVAAGARPTRGRHTTRPLGARSPVRDRNPEATWPKAHDKSGRRRAADRHRRCPVRDRERSPCRDLTFTSIGASGGLHLQGVVEKVRDRALQPAGTPANEARLEVECELCSRREPALHATVCSTQIEAHLLDLQIGLDATSEIDDVGSRSTASSSICWTDVAQDRPAPPSAARRGAAPRHSFSRWSAVFATRARRRRRAGAGSGARSRAPRASC